MTHSPSPRRRAESRKASFGHALRGLVRLLATQANARIQLGAAACAVALGLWLGLSAMEWALLGLTIALVLCAEALNTAIEYAVDLASPEWHALARDAKDIAAGAVLLASLAALGVGLALFLPKLLERW